ncbi:MAG: N-6 DNA methylase [Collinsella intestinalis]
MGAREGPAAPAALRREYAAARASTLTAFYTPQEIARPIWEAIRGMGLGGRVLEPSCGTGAFFAAMPEALAGCRLVGVGRRPDARIARALIRPRRSSTAASSTQTSTTNRSTSRWKRALRQLPGRRSPPSGRGCSCTIGSSRGRSTW